LPATIALKNGWNPFYEKTGGVWADHYPSGVWALRALVFQITEKMDAGRILNIAFAFVSYNALVYYLAARRAALPGMAQKILALSCAASPIVVAELLTNCVDAQVASLFLTLVVCLMLSDDREIGAAALAGAVAATVLLINVKMAGLYFAFFAIAAALAGRWAQNAFSVRWLRSNIVQAGALFLGGVVAVFLVGYRPYVTNVLEHGSVVYPPVKEILKGFYPSNLIDAGQGTKFIYGVFSETGTRALKWPWELHWRELTKSDGFSGGGFGPLFGLEVLGAAALFGLGSYYALRMRRPLNSELLFASLMIIVCCAFFPEPWVARYIPVAPVAVVLLALSAEAALPRIALWAFAGLVFVNLAPIAAKAMWSGYVVGRDVEQSMNKLKDAPGGSRVIIAADGRGAWHGHFLQHLLIENGVSASFGKCETGADVMALHPYVKPRICIAK
jgi:hypothetical protein